MTTFTPISATIGGIFIGAAATLMLYGLGRITGISGIISSCLRRDLKCEDAWRIYFLAGMILGAGMYAFIPGVPKYTIIIEANTVMLIVAGLCVGFGSSLGGGCTSGHGVCGIARLSKRSIIATITFMLTGIITVALLRWGGLIG